jgi:clan AA aspartic protease
MGLVVAKIKLSNLQDLFQAEEGRLPAEAVRTLEIDALADTGAIALAIPEEVAEALGASVISHDRVRVADGRSLDVPIVGGLRVEILGRVMTTDALVLPRGTRPLLGAIQLEFLDLVVVPKTGEVITNPAHPEGATLPLYAAASPKVMAPNGKTSVICRS